MTLDELIEAAQNMRAHLGRGDVGVFTDDDYSVDTLEDDEVDNDTPIVVLNTTA